MPSTWKPTRSLFCVLLSEEFGYASWYWYPGMEPRHLVRWFRGVTGAGSGAPFFSKDLPGRLVRVTSMAQFSAQWSSGKWWTAHAHWTDDSYLRSPEGETILPLCDPNFGREDPRERRQAKVIAAVDHAYTRGSSLDSLRAAIAGQELCDVEGLVASRELDLSWWELGTGLGAVLGQWPAMVTVRELNLHYNHLTDADLIALSASPYLAGLTRLHLSDNPITEAGLRALSQAKMPALAALDLAGIPLTAAAATALNRGRLPPCMLRISPTEPDILGRLARFTVSVAP